MNESYHIPVLLHESINGLNIKPEGTYVDVTFGGGGHSKEILKHLTSGKLIAFDQDKEAKDNVPESENIIFVNHNFRFIKNFLRYYNIDNVDGILADLGVSSHHFDASHRGFSFMESKNLDMRMNMNGLKTAAHILNTYDQRQLIYLFKHYGNVQNANRLANIIIHNREAKDFSKTKNFVEILSELAPKHSQNKYFAKVFQALRIEVNNELDALQKLLLSSVDIMAPGGRFVVITYHSLEDKLVKNFFKEGLLKGQAEKDLYGNVSKPFEQVNKKVIIPTEQEIAANSRARSAKLRIGERMN